ncbi:MAG TPA: hypothetical protein VFC67_12135 [Prolixibacteraceae bacterium]|nr:hypothetical protein [Prolixibacteraceae bacterium]
MKRVCFFILLFVLTNSLNAQTMLNGLMDNYRFKKMSDGGNILNDLKMSDIQGTPYLEEEFSNGKIITSEGTTYDGIPLRYNAYSDDLEFQKGEDTYNIDPKIIIRRAEFGGAVFGCMKYDFFGKIQNGLFEILTEGKATLLVKFTIKFLEKDKVQAFADPKPARFDAPKKEYYMTIDGAPAKLITNKKSLLELFGNRKDEMESYISKNKLSVREDDSLKKIVVHFNSL